MLDQSLIAAMRTAIIADDFAGLSEGIVARQHSCGDGIGHFAAAIRACLNADAREPLRRLDARMPPDTALKFYTRYALAFIAAWEDDVDATSRYLAEVVRLGLAGQAALGGEPTFRQHLVMAAQQAVYLDAEAPLEAPAAGVQAASAGGEAPLLVVTSCNGSYFERFGGAFIASVCGSLPAAKLHIHVANPAGPLDAARFAGTGERLSFSSDRTPDEASFFACKRFTLAHELMHRHRADLLISDIDAVLTPKCVELPALMQGADAGLFERKGVSPMEICHCPLSYFRYGAGALRFLGVLGRYIERKLHGPDARMWMLDQCALFLVSRRAMKGEPEGLWRNAAPRWRNLAAVAALAEFQENQPISESDKKQLRRAAFTPTSIELDAAGKVRVR
jgi:hypothetical protein